MPQLQRRLVRRPRPAEEYEEEDRPRLRRSSQREEPPTRLRRSRSEPDDADRADDDADLRVGSVTSGWGGYKRTKAAAPSKWTSIYKVPDEEQLILFLEDGPYASFLQHWAEWVPKGQKMSYVCLQPDECPLCEVDEPTARVRFNILDMASDPPLLKTLEVGITVADNLERHLKNSPLKGSYWAIGMSAGRNKKSRRTQVRPVKARDVQEDWKVNPLTQDQIDGWQRKLWDESAVERSTLAELQEVADQAAE